MYGLDSENLIQEQRQKMNNKQQENSNSDKTNVISSFPNGLEF